MKRPKLDGFTEILHGWLEEDRGSRHKQRQTAKWVFDRLAASPKPAHAGKGGPRSRSEARGLGGGFWVSSAALPVGHLHTEGTGLEVQCQRYGGLSPATRRALCRIAGGAIRLPTVPAGSRGLGARLVREWNGRTYQVEVLKQGYRMDGRTWPSLSAIAKGIAGAIWSGRRFSGLVERAGGGA